MELQKRGLITSGILINKTGGKDGKVTFKFYANGKIYKESESNNAEWKEALFIGNRYLIIYDSINPENSRQPDKGYPCIADRN